VWKDDVCFNVLFFCCLKHLIDQSERIFHVVVALEPPQMDLAALEQADADSLELVIAAVMVLDYFPDIVSV
jgi:hypothetical protein